MIQRLTIAALAMSTMATAGAPLLLDDFENGLKNWRRKPNAALAVVRAGTGHVLRVEAQFSKQAYTWFRKLYHDKPLDLRAYDGLEFRVKGGGPGCRVLLHLMTDTGAKPVRTFGLARPRSLDSPDWTTYRIAWFELGDSRTGRSIPPEDLAHVEEVNFSITGPLGTSVTVLLDDLRCTRLSPEVLAERRKRLRWRMPIAGESAFFAMLDFTARSGLADVRAALPREAAEYSAAKEALLAHMRSRRTPRYFFDPGETKRMAAAMKALSPTYPKHVARLADRMLTHRYTWEGETRQLSRPIDFVQHGRQWSAVLNRFHYLIPVAHAWWFTGDVRYAEEIVGMLQEWARSCPVPLVGPMGRTWSALEVGVRTHIWLQLYMSVLDSPALTPEANYAILKSLAEHARFLTDPDCPRGLPNMVIIEATGLAGLGVMLPEFREARIWRRRGIELLDTELRRRVLADGAWEEVTPGYHSWVADSCLGFAVLAARNGIRTPVGLERRFRSLYEWLLKVLKPNGRMPMLGDCGDGNAAFFMAEAAMFFDAPEFKYFAPDKLPLRLLERFGADAPATYAAIPKKGPHFGSMLLDASKLAVMRTGYGKNDSFMLFDFGPIWSHTHQDTLGVNLYALGQTLLWDAGVCNYDLPECRDYYLQARAHNVVLVDDSDMQLAGTPVLHAWTTDETSDFVDAEARFTGPAVAQRRQVLFVKPRCWIVRDTMRSAARRRYERLFHVRENATVRVIGDRAVVRDGSGPVLEIRNVRPAAARLEVGQGLITYSHGGDGSRMNRSAPVVRIVNDAPAGTTDLVTVLTVHPDKEPGPQVVVRGERELEVHVIRDQAVPFVATLPGAVRSTPRPTVP
ncbi:MAG: hypothetical protein GXP31_09050 [Kiritimatiellaeota bacterium]|nr:hypothetical protein [Kiritimatiellota bacterium]